ncbi:MAG TPA: hypothetical protein VIR00_05275, partial [Micromonosporaceae bacterium]
MLMHDIGRWLVPAGSDAVPLAMHRQFLAHMAAMRTRFWNFDGVPGLLDPAARFMALTPATGEREA